MKHKLTFALTMLSATVMGTPAFAHFPWLAVNQDGKVIYFFGEHIGDRTYKLPDSIANAEVKAIATDGSVKKISLSGVQSDDFIGLASEESVGAEAILTSEVTYGVYQGSRLKYYTMHLGGKMPARIDAYKDKKAPLDLCAKVVDTDSGVDVYVTWNGKPLADADVTLFCEEGHEEGAAKTDATGKVSFTDREVEEGLNGIMVGHTIEGESGEFDGKAYETASHYLTVTFVDPE